jgi:hypothetical protein
MQIWEFEQCLLLKLVKFVFLLNQKYKVFHIKNLHAHSGYIVDYIQVFVVDLFETSKSSFFKKKKRLQEAQSLIALFRYNRCFKQKFYTLETSRYAFCHNMITHVMLKEEKKQEKE